jgi:hypothetical protein
MIFGWDRDSCGVCHDEIAVAGVDFIDKRPIYGIYLQGGASGRSQRGHLLRVIDLVVDGHEEINIWR